MVIRWLGAFRKRGSLADSLEWELTQREASLLAAEPLKRGRSKVRHARVGLLVKSRAVKRKWRSDVWSERTRRGRLYPTRAEGEAWSSHSEVWVEPDYVAIVVKRGPRHISRAAGRQVLAAARKFSLPILGLTRDGRLYDIWRPDM